MMGCAVNVRVSLRVEVGRYILVEVRIGTALNMRVRLRVKVGMAGWISLNVYV